MQLKIALVGNPNSGKTTLFNKLTGSTAHVGNWPGVTVEHKEGTYKDKKTGNQLQIIDLPGIYSLSPYTPEEVISRDYIITNDSDVVINIVDATNLERNLYLTTQILEMDVPVVIALNMMDVIEKNKDYIDVKAIEKVLGVPIVPISAATGMGMDDLISKSTEIAKQKRVGKYTIKNEEIVAASKEIAKLLEKNEKSHPIYHSIKIIDRDESAIASLNLSNELKSEIDKITVLLEEKVGDSEAVIADSRYKYIGEITEHNLKRTKKLGEDSSSDKIDKILTNRFLGIPIFILVMFLVFHLTFTENLFFVTDLPGPGVFLASIVESAIEILTNGMAGILVNMGASDWAIGLVIDGIFAGVGAVLGFLPLILVLYLFISILEDSGYMARAAFIMDRLLRRFGLSGKSFVPMIMGFGCSVPAITATRTLENERDRKMTIMLIPFMSCGAKVPIYGLIVPIFFPNHTEFVVTAIYLLGIVVAIIAGIIFKNTLFKGEAAPFIMELPPYRMPSLKSLGIHLLEKLKGFATKVGTVITVATIVIWFLGNFGFDNGFGMVDPNTANSILGIIGNTLRFIFIPLGFASGPEGWKAVVAVITGLVAKEAVVSTMGQLYTGLPGDAMEDTAAASALSTYIAASFGIPAMLSFLTWNLLSVPCMAAVGATRDEMGSSKWFWGTIAFQFATAWIVSFIVFWSATLVMKLMGI